MSENNQLAVITARNEVVAKVMFLLVSVILLTGGSASVHAGIPPPSRTPRSRHPPEQTPKVADPPRSRPPPRSQSILGDTVNERVVRILLEYNLVSMSNYCNKQGQFQGSL